MKKKSKDSIKTTQTCKKSDKKSQNGKEKKHVKRATKSHKLEKS